MYLPYTADDLCKTSWHSHLASPDSYPLHTLMAYECDIYKIAALAALLTSTDLATTLLQNDICTASWQVENAIQRLNYYTPRYWKPMVASITKAFADQIGYTGALSYDSLYCHTCERYVEKVLDPQHYEEVCATCAYHSEDCECCETCGYSPCECCSTCGEGPPWDCTCCTYCESTASACVCETCRNCGYNENDCSCGSSNYHTFGSTTKAPWSDRDDDPALGTLPRMEDCQNSAIDPVQAAADFYLLDAIKNMVRTADVTFDDPDAQARFSASIGVTLRSDSMLSAITQSAERSYRNLVDHLAPNFLAYALPAVGGELRYHRCAGKAMKASSRESAWDKFVGIVERKGAETLFEADSLFREFGNGAYGGERWGAAAKVVGQYLAGTMPAWLFVDRVFTLEHNGGCFLNKVNWARTNRPGWGLSKMAYVLNAHAGKHANGETDAPTDWRLLTQVASPQVASMFTHAERHLTRVSRRFGGTLEPIPHKSHIRQYVS